MPPITGHEFSFYFKAAISIITGNESVPIQLAQWHSAGFRGWPFPTLKYKYILQIKYTEAILSNSTLKLLRLEITKMSIEVLKNEFIVSRIIIFGTLSFPIWHAAGLL